MSEEVNMFKLTTRLQRDVIGAITEEAEIGNM